MTKFVTEKRILKLCPEQVYRLDSTAFLDIEAFMNRIYMGFYSLDIKAKLNKISITVKKGRGLSFKGVIKNVTIRFGNIMITSKIFAVKQFLLTLS